MKKSLLLLLGAAFLTVSCSQFIYDDTELVNRLTSLEERVTKLEEAVAKLSDLESDVLELRENFSGLVDLNKDLQEYVKSLENKINSIQSQITSLSKTLSTQDSTDEYIQSQISSLTQQVNGLKTNYSTLNNALHTLNPNDVVMDVTGAVITFYNTKGFLIQQIGLTGHTEVEYTSDRFQSSYLCIGSDGGQSFQEWFTYYANAYCARRMYGGKYYVYDFSTNKYINGDTTTSSIIQGKSVKISTISFNDLSSAELERLHNFMRSNGSSFSSGLRSMYSLSQMTGSSGTWFTKVEDYYNVPSSMR